jgi:hypothetical protein
VKGIYLTEEGKQEIEDELLKIENEVINYAEDELDDIATIKTRYSILKEILSSAIILPVEESWETFDYKSIDMKTAKKEYSQGVIIQPEL